MAPEDPYSKFTQPGSRPVAAPVVPAAPGGGGGGIPVRPLLVVAGDDAMDNIAAVSVLALRGGGASISAAPADIRLKFVAGQTLKYRLHATQRITTVVSNSGGTGAPPIAVDFDGGLMVRVDSVAGGQATISYQLDRVDEKSGGKVQSTQTTGAGDKPPLVLEIGPAGAVTIKDQNFDFGSGGTNAMPAQELYWPLLAGHTVAPGASWSGKPQEVVPLLGSFDYSVQTRLLRYESLGGNRVAVVESIANAPVDIAFKGTFKLNRTAWVDPVTGSLRRSRGTVEYDLHQTKAGAGLQSFNTRETWDLTLVP